MKVEQKWFTEEEEGSDRGGLGGCDLSVKGKILPLSAPSICPVGLQTAAGQGAKQSSARQDPALGRGRLPDNAA